MLPNVHGFRKASDNLPPPPSFFLFSFFFFFYFIYCACTARVSCAGNALSPSLPLPLALSICILLIARLVADQSQALSLGKTGKAAAPLVAPISSSPVNRRKQEKEDGNKAKRGTKEMACHAGTDCEGWRQIRRSDRSGDARSFICLLLSPPPLLMR